MRQGCRFVNGYNAAGPVLLLKGREHAFLIVSGRLELFDDRRPHSQLMAVQDPYRAQFTGNAIPLGLGAQFPKTRTGAHYARRGESRIDNGEGIENS